MGVGLSKRSGWLRYVLSFWPGLVLVWERGGSSAGRSICCAALSIDTMRKVELCGGDNARARSVEARRIEMSSADTVCRIVVVCLNQ